MSPTDSTPGRDQPVILTLLRVLLIVEAAGGVGALLLLSAYLLVTLLFRAFPLALYVSAVWTAMALAIVATLVGQSRIGRGERRWWLAMTALQALVVATGVAILGFYPLSPRNQLVALVLPALAMVNLALLLALFVRQAGGRRPMRPLNR